MEIRLDASGGRSFSYFSDEHNHPLLDPWLTGLCRGHRFMSETNIGHMINMKKGGINVGQIYRVLANQVGSSEYLSFMQRDMYNKISKQRRQLLGDAYAALKYLEDQATNDPSLYFNHHMDACRWWLLQLLKVAVNEKAPISVIMDGDPSMKFAIEKEFPNAHHRLCAWHLIRNWFEMVEGFGVKNKNLILDMYKKRHSWEIAHIRGKFFAGFQTTS
ncbi:protein FAR1-RELATED SEQUENCE 5-like [Arachis duranensis]|uniref:Protein FAR1-RELATED SEQUENCE 5-like n=1 Tax=Arachis duranensis TaxID=130453 RepID=A0A6P4DMD6_ARADU|nr:protein FAR1-RELATED SEQUENCE 5-like [Arachis duranensis]